MIPIKTYLRIGFLDSESRCLEVDLGLYTFGWLRNYLHLFDSFGNCLRIGNIDNIEFCLASKDNVGIERKCYNDLKSLIRDYSGFFQYFEYQEDEYEPA